MQANEKLKKKNILPADSFLPLYKPGMNSTHEADRRLQRSDYFIILTDRENLSQMLCLNSKSISRSLHQIIISAAVGPVLIIESPADLLAWGKYILKTKALNKR